MNEQIGIPSHNILPPVVKHLLIINGIFFLATYLMGPAVMGRVNLYDIFGLHYFESQNFHFWQIITYMFMHGNFGHLFFNMFSLWMFGSMIENIWGSKRFLQYYLVTGIGAAAIHYLIIFLQINPEISLINQFLENPSLGTYQYLVDNCHQQNLKEVFQNNLRVLQANPSALNELTAATTSIKESFVGSYNIVGASGSVFGLLLAFGMLFPNSYIYIWFLLPLKAKYFVIIYGALELFFGIAGTADGIAHFAHLGGMVFGIFMILYWRKKDRDNNWYNY